MRNVKVIVIIGILLVIAIVAIVMMMGKEDQKADEVKMEESTQETQMTGEQEQTEEAVKPVSTMQLQGSVSNVSKDSITILNKDAMSTFPLNETVPVMLIESSGVKNLTIAEIRKGDNVTVTINQADSSLISIQVVSTSAGDAVVF